MCFYRELQDGPTNYWKSEIILKHLKKACEDRKYEIILTFDERGISGHANHCAISRALDKEYLFLITLCFILYFELRRLEHWQLVSLPMWLKYSGPFGILVIIILNRLNIHFSEQNEDLTDTNERKLSLNYIDYTKSHKFGYKAMLEHKSQMAWFRRLYLWISVYMNMNIIEKRIYSKHNKIIN